MGSLSKRILDKAGGAALKRVQRSLERKTPKQVEAYGEKLGGFLFKVGGRRRETAVINLSYAFPEMSRADRLELARKTFLHFGRSAADFLSCRGRTLEQAESQATIIGQEHLVNALALGKGVLLVTGHFGNFERLSAWVALSGRPISVIIRDADQKGVNQLVNDLRTGAGTKVIPRGNSTRSILERLKNNEIVGIIPDQNSDGSFLPFFGKPAGTALGVGVIHERTGAPVITAYSVRVAPCRYEIRFFPPLQSVPGYETKGEGTLVAIHQWLEAVIREYPDQWLWFHDRWRNAREEGLL